MHLQQEIGAKRSPSTKSARVADLRQVLGKDQTYIPSIRAPARMEDAVHLHRCAFKHVQCEYVTYGRPTRLAFTSIL